MTHHCHAHNCTRSVPPKMFMCRTHWFMVPKDMQSAIWRTYRPGQEIDKRPSDDYLRAASAAVKKVAAKEGVTIVETGYDVALNTRERARQGAEQ